MSPPVRMVASSSFPRATAKCRVPEAEEVLLPPTRQCSPVTPIALKEGGASLISWY